MKVNKNYKEKSIECIRKFYKELKPFMPPQDLAQCQKDFEI